MKRFMKVILVEWKIYNRSFSNLFFALVFPVMTLMLFGTMFGGNEPSEFMGGYGTVDVLVSGYICMIIGITGLTILPLTLSQYRERKILKRFMITPIKPVELLCSQLIVNTIATIVGMTLLLFVAKIVFNLNFFGNIFYALVSFIIILLSIFTIGLFIAGVSKNTKAATSISYIAYFPMLFLSGASIPIEAMPESVTVFSKFLPLTYGVRLLKGVWLGGSLIDYINEIFILILIIVIFGILSIKFFKWE